MDHKKPRMPVNLYIRDLSSRASQQREKLVMYITFRIYIIYKKQQPGNERVSFSVSNANDVFALFDMQIAKSKRGTDGFIYVCVCLYTGPFLDAASINSRRRFDCVYFLPLRLIICNLKAIIVYSLYKLFGQEHYDIW